MWKAALVASLSVVAACGSSDDDVSSTTSAQRDLRSDLVALCRENASIDARPLCDGVVEFAFTEAQSHGCEEESAQAYVEKGVATQFVNLPGSDFFDDCPGSSSG